MKKNQIREAITKYFKERDCFIMIRPVSDESKLAHIEDLKWEELKSDFRKVVSNFTTTIKKKLKPKVINGKVLNANMFLQLALEYTEAINNKETPTVMTALDRVVQAETVKIQDEAYQKFSEEVERAMDEDHLPMGKQEYHKRVKKLMKEFKRQLERDLANVLNFHEIISESQKFVARIDDQVL